MLIRYIFILTLPSKRYFFCKEINEVKRVYRSITIHPLNVFFNYYFIPKNEVSCICFSF